MGCKELKAFKLNTASSEGQAEAVSHQCPRKQNLSMISLPKGLIGTKSTGQVKIKGTEFHCLYDTGSQVTTVTHSFYNTYLSDHPINPLNNLLEVEGANGQSVHYLGYVELAVTFPAEFLGQAVNVDTRALVVPDLKTAQPPILIGTNTLDVVYEKHPEIQNSGFHPEPYGYRAVMTILELRHRLSTDDNHGILKLQANRPQTITAGTTVVLDTVTIAPALQGEKAVVI